MLRPRWTRLSEERGKQGLVREFRAEIVSLGGGIVLMICILLTAAGIYTAALPDASSAQKIIAAFLCGAAWFFFVDSTTERLRITADVIEVGSLVNRRRFRIDDVLVLSLSHQTWGWDRPVHVLTVHVRERSPLPISLGVCWSRDALDAFMQEANAALQDRTLE